MANRKAGTKAGSKKATTKATKKAAPAKTAAKKKVTKQITPTNPAAVGPPPQAVPYDPATMTPQQHIALTGAVENLANEVAGERERLAKQAVADVAVAPVGGAGSVDAGDKGNGNETPGAGNIS